MSSVRRACINIFVIMQTRRAFLDMIGSPEYIAIAHLRSEALERSELHPLDPIDPSTV